MVKVETLEDEVTSSVMFMEVPTSIVVGATVPGFSADTNKGQHKKSKTIHEIIAEYMMCLCLKQTLTSLPN